MKKLIASLLSASVLLGAAPLGAAALDPLHTVKQDGVTYSFAVSDGNAEIVSVSGANGSITIPSKLETYSVTAIGDKAFLGQTELEKAVLPKTLTAIGGSAFAGCSALTELTIPDSVKTVGSSAFMSCYALGTVKIGSGVTAIPDDCFFSCPALTEVTLPAKLKSIGNEAFFGCPDVEVTIPSTVTEIGSNALGMQADAHSSMIVRIEDFLIFGKKGSIAEEYAAEQGIDFLDPDDFLAGDVNGDSKVDAKDASAVLTEYSKASTGAALTFSRKQRTIGDMDADGAINSKDASNILIEYARLSTQ